MEIEAERERKQKRAMEEDAQQFPIYELNSPYRLQDFVRLHPVSIQFKKQVTISVIIVSRVITDEVREIFNKYKHLPPLESVGAGFFQLKIDGMNFLLSFEVNCEKVSVVFERLLKQKIDYLHGVFCPKQCEWGQEGKKPPNALLVRGLIYDFLHGVKIDGDRIDFQKCEGPFMPDWENYKKNPLGRAPWPPIS